MGQPSPTDAFGGPLKTADMELTASQKRRTYGALGVVGLLIFGVLVGHGAPDAGPSAFSRNVDGLLLMQRYLESQGTEVRLRTTPWSLDVEEDANAVWLMAFPWRRAATAQELEVLDEHLKSGGLIVLAHSGALNDPVQNELLAWLGLRMVEVLPEPSLWPSAWWRERRGTHQLTVLDRGQGMGDRPTPLGLSRRGRWAPSAPPDAQVLYLGEAGDPMVFAFGHGEGEVVVLPVELWANGWLMNAGNAQVLEGLRRSFDVPWRFDEYHLGLGTPETTEASQSRHAWDLLALHLALLYGLAVWAAGRRFGPPWRELRQTPSTGSTAIFLRGLGTLHRHLGHHRDAARAMVERARQLDPKSPAADISESEIDGIGDDATLISLANRMSPKEGSL